MIHKYFGDRAFFRRVMAVALPIIIQNAITNFVSALDNVMVGQIGDAAMSGVSIVNQLLFVFNLCIFGAVSGAGIFTAQFYGSENHEGVRQTFRFKVLMGLVLGAAGMGIFFAAGPALVNLYIKGKGEAATAAGILTAGTEYLQIMLVGLVPFAVANAYSSTLRETGQTMVPMVAGACAVVVNLVFNYLLIFGHWGLPAMGVAGAAVATVISRFVELGVVALWAHCHPKVNPFIQGAFRSMHISGGLLKNIILKGMPLMVNEALWASGMAVISQRYSTRGLDVVPAMNISGTIYNLASVVYLSMGNVVGILMGQMLGAGASEKALREDNRRLTALSVASCLVFSMFMIAVSGLFPHMYKSTDSVRNLATVLICISAVYMPFNAYTNAAYFTLRSGGQTMVTFLFDSCFVWGLCVPLAYVLSSYTHMGIIPLYILCQGTDLLKCVIGYAMVRSGKWIRNLTHD